MPMSVWEVLLWFSVFVVFYAYLGYPIVLLLISRIAGRPIGEKDWTPEITVIVPVHNQESAIERKIENLLDLDYPREKLHIVISSDGSTDGTDRVVAQYEDRGVRLVRSEAREGKVAAQNRAIPEIRGEVAIFTDTTILFDRDAIGEIVRPLADPEVGCVSSEDDVPGGGEGLYVRYEMLLRRLEARIRTMIGVSGSFYAVRASLVEPTNPSLTRDFLVPLRMIARGFRVVSAAGAKGKFTEAPSSSDEFRRKVRTILRGMDVLFRHRRLLDPARHPFPSFALISHKIIRWLVPAAMIVAFFANAALLAAPHFPILFSLQLLLYASGALARLSPAWASGAPGRASLFFLVTNAAILVAWFRYLRGERAIVWEPTKR